MRKLIGSLAVWILYLVGIIAAFPLVLALLCLGLATKLTCWANKSHTYDFKLVAAGWEFNQLLCLKCSKVISGSEIARVRTEFDIWVASLYHTKDLLNSMLKNPEEKAVEDIIEETKS